MLRTVELPATPGHSPLQSRAVLAGLIAFLASFVAGAVNSIAGGGTLISFPTLIWLGVDPVMANATNTVAIWPGSLAGTLGFRRNLASMKRWLFWLIVPSFAGGALGSWLLLATPSSTFETLVPFLILAATLLLWSQEFLSRRLGLIAKAHENPTPAWVTLVFTFQFLVGLYGGYFGAGIGILMLAALGLIGLTDMHQMNGLKNLLAICINGIAAVYFAVQGAVVWRFVVIMAVGSIAGGFFGTRLAHRFGRTFVRRAVVFIGLAMTVAMFWQNAR
ncbi:MAG: sulfite exporter TauE/SafE family protein [Thermoanaerobaculia bacterium]